MAKDDGRVARRYARAIFELYQPQELDQASGALRSFHSLWKTNKELRDSLKNPANPIGERLEVVRQVAQRIKSGDQNLTNFLCLLLSNGRLDAIGPICEAFQAMIDQLKKRLALEITSAFPIDDGEKGEILGRIQKDFGAMASIAWHVSPELLGGLRIKAGDQLLDSTIDGALSSLTEDLIS